MEALLKQFIELLEEENRLLVEVLKDSSLSERLEQVVAQKERILNELESSKEKLQGYKEYLETIDNLSKRNQELASNNIAFIEELFQALFEEDTTQYGDDGTTKTPKTNLLNIKG